MKRIFKHPIWRVIGRALTFSGATAFVLMFLLPQTRWVALRQITLLFTAAGKPSPSNNLTLALSHLGEQSPQDFTVHYAATVVKMHHSLPKSDDITTPALPDSALLPIAELAQRFPAEPSVMALTIQYGCLGGTIYRAEEDDPRKPSRKTGVPIPDSRLITIEEAAGKGEVLAPDNAFFPCMRAWALLGLHRDSEAMAAVVHAGSKPFWNDYVANQTDAVIQSAERVYGRLSVSQKMFVFVNQQYPHFARMRQTARVVLAKAIAADKNGNSGEAVILRQSLLRYGVLMRTQGRTILSNLVGIAISGVATSRPDGEPGKPRDPKDKRTAAERTREQAEKYASYLVAHGRGNEAPSATATLLAGTEVKNILSKSEDKATNFGSYTFVLLWWVLGIYFLVHLLAEAIGGLAGTIVFSRRKGALPVHLVGVILLVLPFLCWLGLALNGAINGYLSFYQFTPGVMWRGDSSDKSLSSPVVIGVLLFLAIVCVVASLINFRKQKKAADTSTKRTFPFHVAVGLGIGALLWAISVFGAGWMEERAGKAFNMQLVHEGRAMAEQTGMAWPGSIL